MISKLSIIIVMTVTFNLIGPACNEQTETPAEPTISPPVGDRLSTTKLTLADQIFTVELAHTRASRAQGFMFRKEIPSNTGMLFIHSKPQVLEYWMKNCLVDMDIVYIKPDGTIATVYTMTVPPDPEILYPPGYSSKVAVKYALELPAGDAEKLKLTPGEKIKIPTVVTQLIVEPDIIF